MNKKHRKTLADIFTNPVPADIPWTDIIKLLIALDATITQGKGSRVRVFLNDRKAVFHEPHPERETDKGAIKSVRDFLINAGITPGEQ
ncbi:MAG: type II toxin-antitoxin system HicA family toxin [Alkalinema sp. CAN_BIN05]|nr:type II toxin-antitoxin system HicA family toxin [Alkalinema sp. CAN_BIN05]